MDYALKTLSQLRPILLGFRKSAGLTQAAVAGLLGITQQSYAQLEANPASASVERLFKVMRLLNVELRMSHASSASSSTSSSTSGSKPTRANTPKRQPSIPAARKATPPSATQRSGRTQKASNSKRPPEAIKIRKKRENW
jgi:HTH-type transcriptional regulator/antitoxin HipB